MPNLSKRKYPALNVTGTGKWFTGWDGLAFTQEQEDSYIRQWPKCNREYTFGSDGTNRRVEVGEHETRQLSLRFKSNEKGRSSAVAVFADKEGFEYKISFSSLELILRLLHWKRDPNTKYDVSETRIQGSGTWIEGTFMQIKRGQNYFIEPVEVGDV
ncbi:hypothetical protein EXT67_20870 [Pectobacterium atrosepticum]|uniref:Uncharacterized protein n=1 Tax=Pectobacterium phage phiTE TaxID=1116482 RepID=K9L3P4_9CAUD|nr:hypothetical protein [Pectobacterium atrosepticum]YP_007392475.1 hypothetical protein phiTE_013 [Pectobacterium phage phiTE]AEZ66179.1 hypothetical protein phiTE_013 [Pectobacterium phage phiTE]MCL6318756.1 hypothetical protein [Pectobacterium atrosepticum]